MCPATFLGIFKTQQLFWASTHLSDLSFKRGIFLEGSTTRNMFLHLATSLLSIIPFLVWGEDGVKCSSGICLPADYNRMDMPGGKPLRNSLSQILISFSIFLLVPSLARYGSKGLKLLPKRSIVFFLWSCGLGNLRGISEFDQVYLYRHPDLSDGAL